VSNWSTHQFTRKGEQLRTKVEAGKCKLTLTKIKIGNGDVTLGEVKDMNDLKSPQLVLGISSCDVSAEDDRICEVVGIASSSNVESAFSVTEMGLYANDPDVGEILYLVGIDTAPDDMPNKNAQSPVTLTYQFELVTSNMANVVAMISPAGLVTVKMMNAHRTAAELDHPEKSVKRKHLADNVYTLPKPEAANNARFLRNDGTWQQVTADNIGACNKADVAGIYRKIGDQIVDRNTDWNTLTEPMTYIVNGASIDDMHHAPSEYNFGVLDVLRTLCEPEKRIIQIYYPHFSQQTVEKGGMWIRFSNNDIWTQWRHIPTKAENDDRYVKKSGDEITGTLFAPKIQTDNGFEVLGDAGLFFKKHGGGWYMSDDDWMRVNGGKGIHTSGKIACDKGFIGNLQGTSNNSKTLEDKSLQWILDQINSAKTGIVAANLAQNGWVKFANGLIVQWGEVRNTEYNNFPIAYTKFVHVFVVASVSRMSPTDYSTSYGVTLAGDPTLTRFFPVIGDTEQESSLPDKTGVGRWMSIGV
jgi:hypothetical protein